MAKLVHCILGLFIRAEQECMSDSDNIARFLWVFSQFKQMWPNFLYAFDRN